VFLFYLAAYPYSCHSRPFGTCPQQGPKPFWWGQVRVEFYFLGTLVVVTAVLVAMAFTAVFAAAILVTAVFGFLVVLIVLVFHFSISL
jgi:hypothetical protein